jgi:hypothetical protein
VTAMPEEVVGSLHGVGETRMNLNKSNRGGAGEKETDERLGSALILVSRESILRSRTRNSLFTYPNNLLNLANIESRGRDHRFAWINGYSSRTLGGLVSRSRLGHPNARTLRVRGPSTDGQSVAQHSLHYSGGHAGTGFTVTCPRSRLHGHVDDRAAKCAQWYSKNLHRCLSTKFYKHA